MRKAASLFLCMGLLVLLVPASALAVSRTYSDSSDFAEGTFVGVEIVGDELVLTTESTTLPFIWVPNQEGTVSKIDTDTGKELGRYWVSDPNMWGEGSEAGPPRPSRTTVDLQGNCYVGVRTGGTVVKIGLYEAGQYVDRNGNSTIETSQDLNNDGNITGGEILPWGQDECVLYELFLKPGYEGAHPPNTFPWTDVHYDRVYWSTSPRALAIDANNNLWTARYHTAVYFYVDGATGAIQRTVDIEGYFGSSGPYGAVIDSSGVIWTSGQGTNKVVWLDPSDNSTGQIPLGHFSYGMGVDRNNHLFVSGWTSGRLSRINTLTKTMDPGWPKVAPNELRGVAVTDDGDVWTASTGLDRLYRYENDGSNQRTIVVGDGPTGVAVDANGKIWTCNLNNNQVKRVDPATDLVDLTKSVSGSTGHYSYSDMTGIVARSVTIQIGTWTVVLDGGVPGTEWGTVSWTADEPGASEITVEVRAADAEPVGGAFMAVSSGVPFSGVTGQYIEVQTTFAAGSTPVLYDLTVQGDEGDCGREPVCVFIPDSLVFPGDTLWLPVVADTVNCLGIVSVELDILYGDTLAHPVKDTLDYTGALTAGWANEYNVLPNVADTTNLVLIGIATDDDTLTGPPHGALVYLVLAIDDSIWCPDSTYIDLDRVLLNDGIPMACTPQGGWLKIRGHSATIATDPDTIYPRNTVTVTVSDRDEDRDSGAVDTVVVVVTGGGDTQTVVLVETGVSTGVFEGTVSTEYDPSAGIPEDGTLGVVAGDTLRACYSDCLNDVGNTEEICAYTYVIGGVDGTIEVTYVVETTTDRAGVRDTVRVEVTDADEDGPGAVDTVPVQLVDGSVIPADVEDLLLTELLIVASPIFRGRVPTVPGAGGVSGDGVLTLNTLGADLDTIATTYMDTLTAAGGYDTLTAITYVVNRFGDVSANERVGAFDAHLELDFAVGNTVATLREWLVADVDGDSTLLAFDASLILRYVVRLDDSFPVHTYTVRDPKNHPFLKAVGGEMIAFGDAQRQSDGTYLVPMTLADRSGIVSGTFWLSHAPGMEVLGVTTATGYGDFIVAHNLQSEVLRVAFAGAQSSVAGSGEVLWIRVRADEDASLWFGVDDAALNGYRMPMSDVGMFDVSVVEIPETYALHPNVPNPFNPETTIRYDVPSESRVGLVVYNLMGQTVRVLVDGDQVSGRHAVVWDGKDALGRDVGSGMYLLRMQTGSFSESRKMLLLR